MKPTLLSAVLSAALLLSGCATAPGRPAASPRLSPMQEVQALPESLGPLRRTGPLIDFEALPGGAGLGAGARYVPANGARVVVSVTIYDRGLTLDREGAGIPEAEQELRNAVAEAAASTRLGQYRSMEPGPVMAIGAQNSPPEVRCATFKLVQQDGAPTGDSVCLTVQQGRFVKVRLTVWTPPEPALAGLTAGAILQGIRARRNGETPVPSSGPGAGPLLRT